MHMYEAELLLTYHVLSLKIITYDTITAKVIKFLHG